MSIFPLNEGSHINPINHILNWDLYHKDIYRYYGNVFRSNYERSCSFGEALYNTRKFLLSNFVAFSSIVSKRVSPEIRNANIRSSFIQRFSGGIELILEYYALEDCMSYLYDPDYNPIATNMVRAASVNVAIRNELYSKIATAVELVVTENYDTFKKMFHDNKQKGDTVMKSLYWIYFDIIGDRKIKSDLEKLVAPVLTSSMYISQYEFMGGCGMLVEMYAKSIVLRLISDMHFKPHYTNDIKELMEYDESFNEWGA